MSSLFLSLLNMSLSASLVIAVIIALRFVMKKAPRSYFLLLWAVAAVRLVVPVSAFDTAAWFRSSEETAPAVSAPTDQPGHSETAPSAQLSGGSETAPSAQLSGDSKPAPSAQLSGHSETAPSAQLSGHSEAATSAQLPGDSETAPSAPLPGDSETTASAQLPGDSETTASAQLPGDSETAASAQLPGNSETAASAQLPGNSETAASAQLPGGNETAASAQLPGDSETAASAQLPGGSETAPSAQLPGNSETAASAQLPGDNAVASTVRPLIRAEMDDTHVVIVAILWLCGVGVMAIYALLSYLRLSRRMKGAVHLRDNLYRTDRSDGPFLMGFIKPKIYLPTTLSPADSEYVIAHEQAHLRHHDHFIKLTGFVLLTIYWFNPLVWVGYLMLCRDIELACDERVVHRGGDQIKKAYSTALINCSVPRELTETSPLAFGERAVKERVIHVLRYQKPTAAMIAACILAAALVLASCAAPNTVSVSEKAPGDNPASSPSKEKPQAKPTDPFDPAVKAEILAKMKQEADANGGTLSLKVWCASNDYQYEKSVCRQFREEYLADADFHIEIAVKNAIGELDAGYKIIEQKKDGADVFHFGDEQLDMLHEANAISPVPEVFLQPVKAANSSDSLEAASLADTLYAYPKSCDNGYFLYYDKRALTKEDVKDFDTAIAKSREKDKDVFMNFGDAWYATGFYFAAGVEITYQNGVQTANLDSPQGLSAAKAMCHIAENQENGFMGNPESIGHDASFTIGFRDGTLSAAVIGTWEGKDLKNVWGRENLGAVKLPTVLMDGEQKQLHSFAGYKQVGVNAYSQCPFSAHVLAWYLTTEQAQIGRYRERNLLPTNLNALKAGMDADDDTLKIKDDPAFQALADQKPYSHRQQDTVSSRYWGIGVGTFGQNIVKAKGEMDDETLRQRLKQIQSNLVSE